MAGASNSQEESSRVDRLRDFAEAQIAIANKGSQEKVHLGDLRHIALGVGAYAIWVVAVDFLRIGGNDER